MPWIKAKNGNVFEVLSDSLAVELVGEGHKAFDSDPKVKGAKKWTPDGVPSGDSD